MRILALETTERIGSLAILDGPRLVASRTLPAEDRTASTFAVGMKELLAEVDSQPSDLDLIAVCAGPGSFTGLRIGVTAAKTLAYVTGADLVAVNTMEVIALGSARQGEHSQGAAEPTCLWTVMDAFRGQVFAAKFEVRAADADEIELVTLAETEILEVDDWLSKLVPGDAVGGDTVTGPMLGKLKERIPEGVAICEPAQWSPTAENVGRVAWRCHQAGQRDDLWKLVPNYFRKSAAEELADEKADQAT